MGKAYRNDDGLSNARACLKVVYPHRKRLYENAALFFRCRDKGYSKERSIAMANRVHCNEPLHPSNPNEKTAHQQTIETALNRRFDEDFLRTKRDYLSRLYMSYMTRYHKQRPDLLAGVGPIYGREVAKISFALSSPASARLVQLRAHIRAGSVDRADIRKQLTAEKSTRVITKMGSAVDPLPEGVQSPRRPQEAPRDMGGRRRSEQLQRKGSSPKRVSLAPPTNKRKEKERESGIWDSFMQA